MKTYQNQRLRFAIDVPEAWALLTEQPLSTPTGSAIVFGSGISERFNIVIGPLIPEPNLERTEQELRRHADAQGYTNLSLGRMVVAGRAHIWARYRLTSEDTSKKYLLVFDETEYAITATSFHTHLSTTHEQLWDTVVASFRLLPAKDISSIDEHQIFLRSHQLYDNGQIHFRDGRYHEALACFEQGLALSKRYPWHFLGISATVMQMITTGSIPNDRIAEHIIKAEYYIDQCLQIAPTERDYRKMKAAIQNYKRRYQG